MGLRDHLDDAVSQSGGQPLVIQLVVYDLPGRDCAALASNGELGPDDLPRYKSEFIDPIAAILADPAYANLRIVDGRRDRLAAEPGDQHQRPADRDARVRRMKANGNYVNGIGYALAKLGAMRERLQLPRRRPPRLDRLGRQLRRVGRPVRAGRAGRGQHGRQRARLHHQHGELLARCASRTSPIDDAVNGTSVRQSKWVDWNRYVDELSFAQAFRQRLVQAGFPSDIGMLIDTSRNGWGGSARPTGPGPQSTVDEYVNGGRVSTGASTSATGATSPAPGSASGRPPRRSRASTRTCG